jgi:ketosteroid isomerase-like protein
MTADANINTFAEIHLAFGRGDVATIFDAVTDDVDWATGKAAETDLHHYFKFRDGKVVYFRGTGDTAQTEAVLSG